MIKSCYLIVSDIHGSDEGIALVKKAIAHFNPTQIISAGDQCPNPFEPLYSNMLSVRGNCDRFYEYDNLPFPPIEREISLFGRKCIITHGDRFSYEDYNLPDGAIFISGHTHVPMLRKVNGIYLLNPGSPSRPRSSSGATAGLITSEGLELISLLDFKPLSALAFSE